MSGTTGTTMNASLTLRLQDRLSAGLGMLKQRLDGIRASAERIGAMGAIGSGLAIGAPIAQAAKFDDILRSIAITAGKSGAEAETYIGQLRRQFQRLALDTAQSSEAVANAAGLLIQRGLPAQLIDRLLPVAARVATGAGAALNDVAGVVENVNQALGVTPDKLEKAMAILVGAAKEGKVELRDMAREFPALAAAANNFGMKGLEGVKSLGAAIQVAAKASATPSEAANNLANLFQSLTRPETLKNFEKMGVDFPKMLKQAEKEGLNPLEVSLQKVMDLTRGDPIKLGGLIGDMQAGRALMPFLRDFGKEYLRIKRVAGDTSTQVLIDDFLTRMAGPAAKLAILTERLVQLSERFGRELFSRIDSVLAPLEMLGDLIAYVDRLAPNLIGKIVTWTAAALGLAAVLGAVVMVLPVLAVGLRIMFSPLTLIRVALVSLTSALAGVIGMWKAVLVVGGPLLALFALIGAIAYTIWQNWDEFRGFFWNMYLGLRQMLSGFIIFLDGVFSMDMKKIVEGLTFMWEGFKAVFTNIWAALSLVMDKWVDGASAWMNEQLPRLVNAFKAAWESVKTWFSDFWATMTAPIVAFIERVEAFLNRMGQMLPRLPNPSGPLRDDEVMDPHGLLFHRQSFAPGRGAVMGEIVVRAAPGTTVEDISYRGPVILAPGAPPPDRGRVSPVDRA